MSENKKSFDAVFKLTASENAKKTANKSAATHCATIVDASVMLSPSLYITYNTLVHSNAVIDGAIISCHSYSYVHL